MADDPGDKDDKFDFTAEGEALGYISLAQAQVLAMRTARETPGEYGRRFRNVPMAFEVGEASEDEDFYNVTLTFRPQGQFTGTPGQEQFFIEKEGVVPHRQVLSLPLVKGARRLPVVAIIVALLVVGVVAAGGAVFATGALSGGDIGGFPFAPEQPTAAPDVFVPQPFAPRPSILGASSPTPPMIKPGSDALREERDTVQTAMNAMMADQNIVTVDARIGGTAVNTWTAQPAGTGSAVLSGYLGKNTTIYYYCWEANGEVYPRSEDPDAAKQPGGCP